MALPKECKRLAEVDFPIAVVSKHAAREKSIHHGHPSTLHMWWARRPLASCRAMLLALLLPDPCDEHCPEDFKHRARTLLSRVPGGAGTEDEDLRQALLRFIGDFANWDLSADKTYIDAARGLVRAVCGEESPLVVDPFAGGGSIPLEALLVGCEAFASDLNPVACLILKVMLEDVPRQGPELGEELLRLGSKIKSAAERELDGFYPPGSDGTRPLAYLWARTVQCESPNCGADIPLVRSFWLSTKTGRQRALRYKVRRRQGSSPRLELEVFEPQKESDVPSGTVNRSNAKCPVCGSVLPRMRVQAQVRSHEGGADPATLLAVVSRNRAGAPEYRVPTSADFAGLQRAHRRLEELEAEDRGRYVMGEELPYLRSIFNVHVYGINTWGKLFSKRQRLALLTFSDVVTRSKHPSEPRERVLHLLVCLCITRMADYLSSICRWDLTQERAVNTFCRQALGMVWDYAEIVPFAHTVGSWDSMLNSIARVLEALQPISGRTASVVQVSATDLTVPDASATVVFTDPPYYDAVPYANLSDFFVVWLNRSLGSTWASFLENGLAPKAQEIVQLAERNERYRNKTKEFFEEEMARALARAEKVLKSDGISCVVFAHKDTESWEALVAALIRAKWRILSSWPLRTEQAQRLRARDSAALATSVHLVCRPRTEVAVGDWAGVLRELPKRVGEWMERLQGEGVRGADLVFACIGPALEIYSRYSKVVDAEEREIPLGGDPEATEPHKRGFLAYVWEVVGRTALARVLGQTEAGARNGAVGALEEDARLTALFLWTLQSTSGNGTAAGVGEEGEEASEQEEEESGSGKKKPKGLSLPFDVVRRFAQPLGIHLPDWEGRIIEIDKGVVYLMPVGMRGEQLFGEDGARAVADRLEQARGAQEQLRLFPDATEGSPRLKGGGRTRLAKGRDVGDEQLQAQREATTLDRVHAAMLLQQSGRTTALRNLLKAEVERGPEFLRLANALSALYPRDSAEKRLLDAMLLAAPR